MNITKRMLQIGAAAVAVAIGSNALAVGLTIPVQESFESYTNLQSAATLVNWTNGVDDASIITNMTYNFTPANPPGVTYPLNSGLTAELGHQMVLKLNTEGGTLAASLNTDDADNDYTGSKKLYVDTMVNMVISEDDPSFTGVTDVKVAVFANATSNLVIRHGKYALVGPPGEEILTHTVTNTETSVVVDPEKWYRMTITMRELSDGGEQYSLFSVALDGVTVTNGNARTANTWFDVAVTSADTKRLNAIAFQGTGFIDDLVVTTDDPFGTLGPQFFYVVEEWINGVKGGTFTNESDTVAWSKAYAPATAWDKVEIDDAEGKTDAGVFGLVANTVSVTADLESLDGLTKNLYVLTNVAKTGDDLGVPFSSMSEAEIAWIRNFGNDPDDPLFLTESAAFEQAMKLDPYVNEDVTAEITEFVVGDPNSTITVNVQTNGADYVVASGLTVKIEIDGKETLADAWPTVPPGPSASLNVSGFDVNGEASITFATPAVNFFRARIVKQ